MGNISKVSTVAGGAVGVSAVAASLTPLAVPYAAILPTAASSIGLTGTASAMTGVGSWLATTTPWLVGAGQTLVGGLFFGSALITGGAILCAAVALPFLGKWLGEKAEQLVETLSGDKVTKQQTQSKPTEALSQNHERSMGNHYHNSGLSPTPVPELARNSGRRGKG